jgi:hypothetical protein
VGADWGIDWQDDLSLHKHITSVQSTLGLDELGSSEHFDFQQQESGNCWGIKSLDVLG